MFNYNCISPEKIAEKRAIFEKMRSIRCRPEIGASTSTKKFPHLALDQPALVKVKLTIWPLLPLSGPLLPSTYA